MLLRQIVVTRALSWSWRCFSSAASEAVTVQANNQTRNAAISDQYRSVMRNLPSPVAVVTTRSLDSGEKRGLTVSSFTSVSLNPPIVSFCVNKLSRFHNLLLRSNRFAAHILRQNQVQLSVQFSSPTANGDTPFQSVAYYNDPNDDLPILMGTLGVLHCDVIGVHQVGDHHLWLGQVNCVEESLVDSDPLIYYGQSYRTVGEQAFLRAFEDTSLQFSEWTHKAHVRMAWNYLREHGRERAVMFIREGIQRYNEKNKDFVRGHEYNETTTLFFVHLIDLGISVAPDVRGFATFFARFPKLQNWQIIYQYYSRDLLRQDKARKQWMPPDLKPLPMSVVDLA